MSNNSRRKREDGSSSSPEVAKPPLKSVKKMASAERTTEEMWCMLQKIQENTDKLLEENRNLRSLYQDLTQSLEFHIKKIEDLEKENKTLRDEVDFLQEEATAVRSMLNDSEESVKQVSNAADDLEQYTRKYNLEFHGISEEKEEDIEEHIVKLGSILNVNINKSDIDICHRMKSRRSPRPIIARFASHKVKQSFYFAKKRLKNADLSQAFPNTDRIYINENLTAQRRKLFKEVRDFQKEHNWNSAWTIDGKIFVKKDIYSKPLKIVSENDLIVLA